MGGISSANSGLLLILLFLSCLELHGQKVQAQLHFEPGKTLNIQMSLKATVTQQAMNNAISFEADGSVLHCYKVMSVNDSKTTLQHEGKKINFSFSGMGQKRSFNSENSADFAGQFGEPIKSILAKKFEMTIDEYGNVMTTNPEKIEPVRTDERLAIVLNMIKDISDVVYPPQRGQASFFKVLPSKEITIGESWADSSQNENGNIKTVYTLAAITDSTIVVEFKSSAITIAKTTLMGNETTTTLSGTGTGKIILDKATGILKEKTTITESGGSMEAMGGTTPVTSKTIITIHVNPGQ